MIKRILSGLLACLLFVGSLPLQSMAATPAASEETIYFEDGSYLTTVITGGTSRASGDLTKTKLVTYRDSNDHALWDIALTASFIYTGLSATCTSCSAKVTIYSSNWYEISKSTSRDGGSAICNVEMGRKILGITLEKIPHTVTLTCDKDGNVS